MEDLLAFIVQRPEYIQLILKPKESYKPQLDDEPTIDLSNMTIAGESSRFEVDDQKAVKYLENEGYVVFKQVLKKEEIETATNLFWKWLENLCPGVKRDQPDTWNHKNWPADKDNGIISEYGVGQAEWTWYIRGRKKVKQAYSNIWDTDKLLVSFGGGNIFRPWGYKSDWKTKGGWWHVDQNR
eukprot:UN30522